MPSDLTPPIAAAAAPAAVAAAGAADSAETAPAADFAALLALELQGGGVKAAALPAAGADGDDRSPAADGAAAAGAAQDPAALLQQCAAPLPGPCASAAPQNAFAPDIPECAPAQVAAAPARGSPPRAAAIAQAPLAAGAQAQARDAAPAAMPGATPAAGPNPAAPQASLPAPAAALRSSEAESPRLPHAAAEIAGQRAPLAQHESAPPPLQLPPMLPPAASPLAATTASAAGARVEPRIASREWGDALGQRVVWMVAREQQIAELHLNPPDLGPLQVVLSVSNDQANAQFFSHHAVVREAVEAALPQLRQMLADNGIALGQASVGSDASNRRADSGRAQDGAAGGVALPEIPASAQAQSLKFRDGLVDTFA